MVYLHSRLFICELCLYFDIHCQCWGINRNVRFFRFYILFFILIYHFYQREYHRRNRSLIARFMEATWGPSGAGGTQVGPMLAPWTFLSGTAYTGYMWFCRFMRWDFISMHHLNFEALIPRVTRYWEHNKYQYISKYWMTLTQFGGKYCLF